MKRGRLNRTDPCVFNSNTVCCAALARAAWLICFTHCVCVCTSTPPTWVTVSCCLPRNIPLSYSNTNSSSAPLDLQCSVCVCLCSMCVRLACACLCRICVSVYVACVSVSVCVFAACVCVCVCSAASAAPERCVCCGAVPVTELLGCLSRSGWKPDPCCTAVSEGESSVCTHKDVCVENGEQVQLKCKIVKRGR